MSSIFVTVVDKTIIMSRTLKDRVEPREPQTRREIDRKLFHVKNR